MQVELVATTKDVGTTLRAPTSEAGLSPACKDTCFADLSLRLWEKRYDGSEGKVLLFLHGCHFRKCQYFRSYYVKCCLPVINYLAHVFARPKWVKPNLLEKTLSTDSNMSKFCSPTISLSIWNVTVLVSWSSSFIACLVELIRSPYISYK